MCISLCSELADHEADETEIRFVYRVVLEHSVIMRYVVLFQSCSLHY